MATSTPPASPSPSTSPAPPPPWGGAAAPTPSRKVASSANVHLASRRPATAAAEGSAAAWSRVVSATTARTASPTGPHRADGTREQLRRQLHAQFNRRRIHSCYGTGNPITVWRHLAYAPAKFGFENGTAGLRRLRYRPHQAGNLGTDAHIERPKSLLVTVAATAPGHQIVPAQRPHADQAGRDADRLSSTPSPAQTGATCRVRHGRSQPRTTAGPAPAGTGRIIPGEWTSIVVPMPSDFDAANGPDWREAGHHRQWNHQALHRRRLRGVTPGRAGPDQRLREMGPPRRSHFHVWVRGPNRRRCWWWRCSSPPR